MESIKINEQEYKRLLELSKSSNHKLYSFPIFYLLPIIIISILPVKYLPRKLGNNSGNQFNDDTLISLIGTKYFLIFLLLWTIIMGIASLATYKNIGLRKDLKQKTKLRLTAKISRVDKYDGVHYVRLKGSKQVNILHFDKTNYVPLQVGDNIEFEIYEFSKKLIRVISRV